MQNDPYEFKGMYWKTKELLDVGVQQQSIDNAYDLFFCKIALAAFTANMSNNLPMWAHYANNHHGYCVKYKVNNKRIFRNVIYDDNRYPVTNIFLNFLQHGLYLMSDSNSKLLTQVKKDFVILQDKFFLKHTSWAYENEYRALYELNESTMGLNVPISELELSVEEIYSGINCCENNKLILSQIADSLGVPYKECSMSDTIYTVFEEKIV